MYDLTLGLSQSNWWASLWPWLFWGAVGAVAIYHALGLVYIPNDRIGVIERLWSPRGSVKRRHIIACRGEAGYQAKILRGGLHLFYWRLQYRVHKMPLVMVSQGKIGYVYARDGTALKTDQTLARVVPCDSFQNAPAFLLGDAAGKTNPAKSSDPVLAGQRGRQRAILREGFYAINLAMFIVITEEQVYRLKLDDKRETQAIAHWHQELAGADGFNPVVIGARRNGATELLQDKPHANPSDIVGEIRPDPQDNIGVVTVHDGSSLDDDQIIAPPVATKPDDPNYHNSLQDIEAFLAAGGRRGRQYAPLTDGTYFINRWFGSVELIPKTVVPIGHVGVVVSYFGKSGHDVSGTKFRHGERVAEGERGVLEQTLGPGKYPFNTYAGRILLVPTTNFVLHWVTGRTENHRYDESLKSIDLVTADAYEPVLPLSVVVHIDYEKAPNVVQRFGDVKKLITQTLDPLLSAYFRDIAHRKTMLELLHERDVIQREARAALRSRFAEFDIELLDVLIGKPDSMAGDEKIESLLEQLRMRQLSREQIETYQHQCAAAGELKTLKQAQALADKQTELSQSQVLIEITQNKSSAELVQARTRAEQTVIQADAESKKRLVEADSQSKAESMIGAGNAKRKHLEGEAEAVVLKQKVLSLGDPKLYALNQVAHALAHSKQPLVPQRLFIAGGGGDGAQKGDASSLVQTFLGLLTAEKAGLDLGVTGESAQAQEAVVDSSPVDAGDPENGVGPVDESNN